MTTLPTTPLVILAVILFGLGTAALLARRNILFILVAIEVMLNAAGLAFIAAGARWAQADGQVFFILILATAGSEVAVGLALVLLLNRGQRSLDIDRASRLRG